jgi:formylglycine-generating enzyme required for sulfatase activity
MNLFFKSNFKLILLLFSFDLFTGCSSDDTSTISDNNPLNYYEINELDSSDTNNLSYIVEDIDLELLWVEPGTYPRPKGTENVEIHTGFWLGKHEVTVAQWKNVMGQYGESFSANRRRFKRDDIPVVMISLVEVNEFCRKITEIERNAGRLPDGLSFQLPNDVQWEIACLAGTKTIHPFGEKQGLNQANVKDKYFFYSSAVGEPTNVGNYPPNRWGFHDMIGNVWEMCYDVSRGHQNALSREGLDTVPKGVSYKYLLSSSLVPIRGKQIFKGLKSFDIGFRVSLQSISGKDWFGKSH